MQRAWQIESARCTACLECEMACSFASTGAFNPSRLRIKVCTFHDRSEEWGASGSLEYEGVWALRADTRVDCLDAWTFANLRYNEGGIDPTSVAATVAAEAVRTYDVAATVTLLGDESDRRGRNAAATESDLNLLRIWQPRAIEIWPNRNLATVCQ